MTEEEKMKAMRVARAIASDISLYNEAKITKGLEDDTLFTSLKDEIDQGYDHFKTRVSAELWQTTNIFWRAFNDIIIARKSKLRSKIW